ncbi:hypothetical protein B7486_16995 [cyanobacterium TDX16]|nr:hypothetical protein B7486_16995 [cyanobacterium TDX16]
MVFVLGMLTLLALVGLVMITRTHGEARRVNLDASSQTARSAMSSVVRSVQDRLWRDIWGPSPDTINPPRPLNSNRPAAAPMVLENNEAFDAPGENDRWLSSTIPYLLYETDPAAVLPPVYGEPRALPTYIGVTPPPGYPLTEDHVLSWRNVSYIGSDLLTNDFLQGGVQPFAWAQNSRIEAPIPVQYSTTNLENVNIMQTPPPASYGLAMIPGSTTNVTISEARDNWLSLAHQTSLGTALPGVTHQFPYFDTNADGAVDLYDADGDGVPDSPLSMVIPIDTEGANNPRQLYAAVRVVDHGGMLNVNTASSLAAPSGGNTFDEGLADLQRRGRRATEIVLDEVVHPDDALGRTTEMMSYRSDGALDPDPIEYDADVVRRELIGGTPSTSVAYHPYGISEEASLRHRNMLVPYGRKSEWEEVVNGGGDEYVNIDRALMGSMQWTRQMNGLNETSYMRNAVTNVPRWNRFNASWGAADYEGVPSGGTNKGWRTMIDEHHRYFVRRPLLTTVSHFIEPPPVLTAPAIPSIDTRIVQLRALGMDWPVLDTVRFGSGVEPTLSAAYENLPDVPEWARPQHIDLNMGSLGNGGAAKEDFIRYSAAAMYLALEGVGEYQGQSLADDRNRQWLAWQFAVNIADYRDVDNEPTIVTITPAFGPPFRVFGIEKQPFLTEAYAFVTAGNAASGPRPVSGPGDKWFFAFELFVPPLWKVPLNSPDNLYIRVQPSIPGLGLLPLSSFRNAGNFPPVLSADGDGDFFVLCGSKADAPSSLTPLVLATFFSNPQFKIPVNGQGTIQLVYSATGIDNDPADTAFHVLDTISPENSGDIAANTLADFVNLSNDITSVWARRDPGWAVGTKREFSLLRSTKGWRFTTALQRYSEGQPPPLPQSRPLWLRPSLGKQNTIQDSLDKIVPQNIWPARARMTDMGLAGIDPRDSFNDPQPYHDFDSVGDLSRMLMIGAFNRTLNTDPPLLSDRDGAAMIGKRSVPELLTETLARSPTTDLIGDGLIRIAAGHVDFKDAIKVGGRPWTAKLTDYFTTSSAFFDQIDNDGDGLFDLADPTEGSSLLYRTAGKININTAPVSVLRSVPFMSLMPGSVEYINAGLSSGSPVNDFAALAPNGAFWDLASAIVSRREVRRVPVFEWDPVSLRMRIVAVAGRPAAAARPTPADSGPFGHLFELPNMLLVTDRGGTAGDALFHIDRYALTPAPILDSHKVRVTDPSAGPSDIFSPDFRFRRADDDNDGAFSTPEGYYLDYIPVVPTGLPAPAPENPGLRARDIFLSRLANMLTVRSDVFTVYVALIDENGQYVRRSQLTLDRSECFRRPPVAGTSQPPTLPNILTRSDGSYAEDVR